MYSRLDRFSIYFILGNLVPRNGGLSAIKYNRVQSTNSEQKHKYDFCCNNIKKLSGREFKILQKSDFDHLSCHFITLVFSKCIISQIRTFFVKHCHTAFH